RHRPCAAGGGIPDPVAGELSAGPYGHGPEACMSDPNGFREPDIAYWNQPLPRPRPRPLAILGIALVSLFAASWLILLLILPLTGVVMGAFRDGLAAYWAAITTPDALHAVKLTVNSALIALPINLVFGVGAAWLLTRHDFRGKRALSTLIDVPFTVSPVIGGL